MIRRMLGKILTFAGIRAPHKDQNQIYDDLTEQIIHSVLGQNDRAIDIGCNRGLILRAMIAAAPNGQHIAFEPIPLLAKTLAKKFPSVRIVQAAVADKIGRSSFNHVLNDDGYSGLRQRTYDRPDPKIELIDVTVTTLSHEVTDDIPTKFIKIDIEGGEYHVLVGGRELIAQDKPVIVFEAGVKSSSHYNVTPSDFEEFFSGVNYSIYRLEAWLDDAEPIPMGKFSEAWENDYYFLAAPQK